MKLLKQQLKQNDIKKIKSDLIFLKLFFNFAHKNHFRVVVAGGYGIDGALGVITRPHNDLDLIVYARENRKKLTLMVKKFINNFSSLFEIAIKDTPFSTEIRIEKNDLGADIYLIQTVNNPLKDISSIKMTDGKIQFNSLERFPNPILGRILGLKFEVENPHLRLAHILYKRNVRKEKEFKKHEQDIKNLKLLTDKEKVNLILSKM